MLRLYEKLTMLAATSLSLLTSLALSSPVVGPEPIRCAPCTQEKLDECPAISPDCKQVLREPGCGCCLACALEKGASCGVYTAHCAPGLKCSPRPGDPRPLHSLTRGQAICTEDQGQEGVPDHSYLTYLLGLNTPFDTKDEGAQESIEAKVNTIRKKLVEQGPCHIELHAALDKITSSQQELGEKFTTFYLPNCDKHGFYKAKQCESSLVGPPAMCWCVLLEWVEDYGVQLSTRRLRVPAGAHSLNHGHSDPHSQAHACTRIDTYTEYFFTQLKHT